MHNITQLSKDILIISQFTLIGQAFDHSNVQKYLCKPIFYAIIRFGKICKSSLSTPKDDCNNKTIHTQQNEITKSLATYVTTASSQNNIRSPYLLC